MSYELQGFGPPRPRIRKPRASMLPYPNRRTVKKRRTPAYAVARTMPRLPAGAVEPSQLTGLGFSLKPPKWVRKLTIKKVIKPVLIGAAVVGAAMIPGALPLVGKAAGLLAKGVVGAGRFVARSGAKVASGFKSSFFPQRRTTVPTATPQPEPAPQPRPTGPSGTLGPSEQVPYSPPTYAPAESAATYGGGGAPMTADSPAGSPPESPAPAPAGMSTSSLVPIGLGLVALVAVSGALKGRRR